MVAEMVPTHGMRGPGCGDVCRGIYYFQPGVFGRQRAMLHDPEAHERYGRILAGDPGAMHVIETGVLTLNRDLYTVSLRGQQVHLSATETRLVFLLAERIGRLVPYATIMTELWDWKVRLSADMHLVRAHLARLRARLGPDAEGLIVAEIGLGLRMLSWPSGAPGPRIPGSNKGGRWARGWDACVLCGSTTDFHQARGFCCRCYDRAKTAMAGAL